MCMDTLVASVKFSLPKDKFCCSSWGFVDVTVPYQWEVLSVPSLESYTLSDAAKSWLTKFGL